MIAAKICPQCETQYSADVRFCRAERGRGGLAVIDRLLQRPTNREYGIEALYRRAEARAMLNEAGRSCSTLATTRSDADRAAAGRTWGSISALHSLPGRSP